MVVESNGAQAGLEYLMTYGWALVLIITVASVLFFIMDASNTSVSFSSSAPTKIFVRTGTLQGDTAKIQLQNATGGKIDITSIIGNNCTIAEGTIPLKVVSGGIINLQCYSSDGKMDLVSITYTDFAGMQRSVNITASGKGAADSTLVAYYKFDEGTDSIASDSSGNNNNGTISGATWQSTGCQSGNCIYFNSAGNSVSVPDSKSLDITGNITMSAHIKIDKPKLDNMFASIIEKGNAYRLFASDTTSRPGCGDAEGYARAKERIFIPGMEYDIRCAISGISGAQTKIYANTRKEPIYTIGDSITEGYPNHGTSIRAGAASGDVTYTYQYWLDHFMGSYTSAESNISYYNLGWAGQTCEQIYDRFSSNIPVGVEVILMCGINDILSHGADATEVENNIQAIYNLANSRSNTLYILEILPCNGTCNDETKKEYVLAVNSWLDLFAASNPNVHIIHTHNALSNGNYGCVNSAYFYSAGYGDGLHPDIDGQKRIAEEIWKQGFNSAVSGFSEQLTETSGNWNGIENTNDNPLLIGSSFKGTIDEAKIFGRPI